MQIKKHATNSDFMWKEGNNKLAALNLVGQLNAQFKHKKSVHYGRSKIPRVPNSSFPECQALGEANLPWVLHSGKKCTRRRGAFPSVVKPMALEEEWHPRKTIFPECNTQGRGALAKGNFTRPETICPGTSKLACWRVQLSTASKVGRRGTGTATASIEASLLAGDISDPPAKMVPFMLADELCWPPA
jgi:hypothetical protein